MRGRVERGRVESRREGVRERVRGQVKGRRSSVIGKSFNELCLEHSLEWLEMAQERGITKAAIERRIGKAVQWLRRIDFRKGSDGISGYA